MNKIFKMLVALLVTVAFTSCGNSKLKDTNEILGSIPVFIAQQRVDQKVEVIDNNIVITIPEQGDLATADGKQVTDGEIVTAFLQNLFNAPVSQMVIGRTMDTAENSSPVEDYITAVADDGMNFVIKYNGKDYKLTPDQMRNLLKSKDLISADKF